MIIWGSFLQLKALWVLRSKTIKWVSDAGAMVSMLSLSSSCYASFLYSTFNSSNTHIFFIWGERHKIPSFLSSLRNFGLRWEGSVLFWNVLKLTLNSEMRFISHFQKWLLPMLLSNKNQLVLNSESSVCVSNLSHMPWLKC
jgi:hypothetical protein